MSNKEHYELNTPNLIEVGQEIQARVKQGYEISYGPELVGWLYIVRFERASKSAEVARATPQADIDVASHSDEPTGEAVVEAKPAQKQRGPKPKKSAE
jgi:hypothetical protein